jgi:hypothetical protein
VAILTSHLEAGVCVTHDPGDRHVPRLSEYADPRYEERTGPEVVDDLVRHARMLEQANLPFCDIAYRNCCHTSEHEKDRTSLDGTFLPVAHHSATWQRGRLAIAGRFSAHFALHVQPFPIGSGARSFAKLRAAGARSVERFQSSDRGARERRGVTRAASAGCAHEVAAKAAIPWCPAISRPSGGLLSI